ncbi:MAG: preprotein translocase subunit SecG [Planctomycetota bacterium]
MAPNLPTVLPTLAIGPFVTGLAILFAVVCLALMLIVLAQKPKGGGLAGAFGGGGGSEGAFVGAKIGDWLTWFTVALFVAFIGLAMGLTWAINPAPPELADPATGAGTNSTTSTSTGTAATTPAAAGETLTEEPAAATETLDLSEVAAEVESDADVTLDAVEEAASDTPPAE